MVEGLVEQEEAVEGAVSLQPHALKKAQRGRIKNRRLIKKKENQSKELQGAHPSDSLF